MKLETKKFLSDLKSDKNYLGVESFYKNLDTPENNLIRGIADIPEIDKLDPLDGDNLESQMYNHLILFISSEEFKSCTDLSELKNNRLLDRIKLGYKRLYLGDYLLSKTIIHINKTEIFDLLLAICNKINKSKSDEYRTNSIINSKLDFDNPRGIKIGFNSYYFFSDASICIDGYNEYINLDVPDDYLDTLENQFICYSNDLGELVSRNGEYSINTPGIELLRIISYRMGLSDREIEGLYDSYNINTVRNLCFQLLDKDSATNDVISNDDIRRIDEFETLRRRLCGDQYGKLIIINL